MINIFINRYLEEDIGSGDHTSMACIPNKAEGKVYLLVKENCVIAGIEVAKEIVQTVDREIKLIPTKIKDGDCLNVGDIVFYLEGKSQSLLQAERLVLNCMQRMSGIATLTQKYAQKIAHTSAKVLDTRKTTPGFRVFEKMAVKIGGGNNHRMGLYDMIMIKDNHIDFSGGIQNAVEYTNEYLKKKCLDIKIEIEVRDFEELQQVLQIGKIDRIMLDNFSVKDTVRAVKMINKQYEIESSGGITDATIVAYAEAGVDFISVGALTHQAKSVDLSLKVM